MALLFNELLEKLRQWDEVSLLELLDIRSDDLVDRFEDIIEERQELIREALEDTDEQED